MSEIIDRLIKQASDIEKSGISGYGNTMMDAIEEIKCITQRNKELEAELARFREQEHFWYAVVSKKAPVINKAIRSEEVAYEYADQCRNSGYDVSDIEVVTLYAQPNPPELPDVDALAEFMQEIYPDCFNYKELAKRVCEWLKKGGV